MAHASVQRFIGKTYAEVRKMHEDVRVVQAGEVSFHGTCDYQPTRLNIKLGPENITVVAKSVDIGGESFPYKEVEGSMDAGIVVSASWG